MMAKAQVAHRTDSIILAGCLHSIQIPWVRIGSLQEGGNRNMLSRPHHMLEMFGSLPTTA